MASYRSSYGTAVSDRLISRLRRLGRVLFAELARAAIAVAALGFAAITALYGAFYLCNSLVDALGHRMPHWAALLTTASAVLMAAGAAVIAALWQLSRMRTVRATAAVLARTAPRTDSV